MKGLFGCGSVCRFLGLFLLLLSCGDPSDPGGPAAGDQDAVTCQPTCGDRACGDNGCGGSCGSCPLDQVCNDLGLCVADPGDPCSKTCAQLGLECGTHCGESCGTCAGEQAACVEGRCRCVPACDAATCGQPDGCGTTCGPCPSLENCADCGWRLALVDQEVVDGLVTEITVALDFNPALDAPLPGMADIRFKVTGPVKLQTVGVGPAVMASEKEPLVNADTGQPFTVLANGIHQVLLFSTANTNLIGAGRWLLLRFRFQTQEGPLGMPWLYEPAVISLVDRDEVFAPPPADFALGIIDYDAPVVIWPEVVQ